MIETYDVPQNQIITDEFPNAAHMRVVGQTILDRRAARNRFWRDTSFDGFGTFTGKVTTASKYFEGQS